MAAASRRTVNRSVYGAVDIVTETGRAAQLAFCGEHGAGERAEACTAARAFPAPHGNLPAGSEGAASDSKLLQARDLGGGYCRREAFAAGLPTMPSRRMGACAQMMPRPHADPRSSRRAGAVVSGEFLTLKATRRP